MCSTSCIESDWDSKTTSKAYGLMKIQPLLHLFKLCFIFFFFFFGYIRGISVKLQGSTMNILDSHKMIDYLSHY